MKTLIFMDKEKLWQDLLNQLQLTVTKSSFSVWFDKTFIKEIKEKKEKQIITVGCPHSLVCDRLKKNYLLEIKKTLETLTQKKTELEFIVASTPKLTPEIPGPLFNFNPEKEKEKVFSLALKKARINSTFTFNNFCVASTNEMAYAAATTVAKNPGQIYNPLFIYGGVGVGKTHLMQAIGIDVLSRDPTLSLIYCTGEEFTNEIIEAIRNKTTGIFKKKFRNAKLLMIDDIQFIAGRDFVQEEFFHTFNAIKQLGGQIVMTSDRLPEQIDGLEDRLRSRFEGGLMIDIQEPNFELRTAILLTKAKQMGEELPIEIAKMIAQEIKSTRKLEGILIRILSEKGLGKKNLDIESVKKILNKVKPSSENKLSLTPQKIIERVALHYQLKLNEIKSSRRLKQIVFPRQVAIYFIRNELNLPYEEIGRLFGGKDHTTIMHAEDKIKNWLSSSPEAKEEINFLKQKIFSS